MQTTRNSSGPRFVRNPDGTIRAVDSLASRADAVTAAPEVSKKKSKRLKKPALHIPKPKLSVPSLRLSTPKVKPGKKLYILLSAVLVLALGAGVYLKFFAHKTPANQMPSNISGTSVAAVEEYLNKADLDPIIPKVDDPTAEASKPYVDSERGVYSFESKIGGIKAVISQQPLPDNIKSDPQGLLKIAFGLGARSSLNTDKGEVFTVVNNETKIETIVFKTEKLLVFIKTASEIEASALIDYVNSLQVK